MFKLAGVIIIALSLTCNSAALAEPVTVAFASQVNNVQDRYQDPSLDNMDIVLHEHVYKIQQETSHVQFHVRSTVGDVWVSFDDFKGDFTLFGNADNSNVASIEVNARSMDTRRGMVKMLLKSAGFLDVENFPRMKFVGSSIEWFSDTQAILKGMMTIRDKTGQVDFYLELVDSNIKDLDPGRVSVKAMATIKRSEFGITTLLPVVNDQVNLIISINALKKDAALSMN